MRGCPVLFRATLGGMSDNSDSNGSNGTADWYFDTSTGEVSRGKATGWDNRMGPYDTEAAARAALETARARTAAADDWDED